jgi:hypothetical protein
MRLTRAARVLATGQALARGGRSTIVRLRGSVRAGQRCTPTATLPPGPRTRTKVSYRIVLR